MTKNNQDALRTLYEVTGNVTDANTVLINRSHLRRLVAENEEKESALKIVEKTCDDFANQIEVKDALLRQAVEALECLSEHGHRCNRCDSEVDEGGKLIDAIRQHLEGKA